MKQICGYGCGNEALYPPRKGQTKWCCSENFSACTSIKKKNSIKKKKEWNDPSSIFNSISYRENISDRMIKEWDDSNSVINSMITRERQSRGIKNAWKDPNNKLNTCKEKRDKSLKLNIEKLNKRYPFFSKIEEMRYNPDKPEEKEIQVHCKNHNCKNSKEKGGWFIPTYNQLSGRINAIEKINGNDGNYFYCSQHCKNTCPLYNVYSDPFKDNTLPYTQSEYQTCRTIVFERENGLCEYCGEPATDMHHIFPVKLEPFFALDPDYCVACCEKHHYKYAHKDECSTGSLAKITCNIESQKFLNQTLEDI